MKALSAALILAVSVGLAGPTFAQTLEIALKCDDAEKKLTELAKTPETDVKDISGIAKAVGTAVLISCDVPAGKIVCYQCIGQDGKLRSLEVLHNHKSKSLDIKGYGCRCSGWK